MIKEFKVMYIFSFIFTFLLTLIGLFAYILIDYNKIHEIIFSLTVLPFFIFLFAKATYDFSFIYHFCDNKIKVTQIFALVKEEIYDYKELEKIEIRNDKILLCYNKNKSIKINVNYLKKQKIINHIKINTNNYDDLLSKDVVKFNWIEFLICIIGLIFLLILKNYFIEDTINYRNSNKYTKIEK